MHELSQGDQIGRIFVCFEQLHFWGYFIRLWLCINLDFKNWLGYILSEFFTTHLAFGHPEPSQKGLNWKKQLFC
jgi:hypothetical protein